MAVELCVFMGEALSHYHFGATHPFGLLGMLQEP